MGFPFSAERPGSQPHTIEQATDFQDAVEIISEKECRLGMRALCLEFANQFRDPREVILMPVLRGGRVVGEQLARSNGVRIDRIRASYYNTDGSRRPQPVVLEDYPIDLDHIIVGDHCRPIVFAEAVVETGETIAALIKHINALVQERARELGIEIKLPEYHVFALIDKTRPGQTPNNLVAAFRVNPDIWVHGWGCDNQERGREFWNIMGVRSPFAKPDEQIERPYYERRLQFR